MQEQVNRIRGCLGGEAADVALCTCRLGVGVLLLAGDGHPDVPLHQGVHVRADFGSMTRRRSSCMTRQRRLEKTSVKARPRSSRASAALSSSTRETLASSAYTTFWKKAS